MYIIHIYSICIRTAFQSINGDSLSWVLKKIARLKVLRKLSLVTKSFSRVDTGSAFC